jgi:hypothetical protein
MCYLYRHAIELGLKDALTTLEAFLHSLLESGYDVDYSDKDLTAVEKLPKRLDGHDLNRLLNRLRDKVRLVDPTPLCDRFESIVKAIHALDPTGEKFRYARTRVQGSQFEDSFKQHMSVGVDQVVDDLRYATTYILYGVSGWLDEMEQNLQDYKDYVEDMMDELPDEDEELPDWDDIF